MIKKSIKIKQACYLCSIEQLIILFYSLNRKPHSCYLNFEKASKEKLNSFIHEENIKQKN